MRGQVLTWSLVALVIAALAWPTWTAWRHLLARRVYAAEGSPAPAVTPQHIAGLRMLRFAWSTLVESGGPVVDPWTPYGSEDMAADLAPLVGTRDPVVIARFHREISAILIEALGHCGLTEGQYRLAHLDNAWMKARLRRDLAGVPAARIEAVVAQLPRLVPDGHFRFTDQHRRLVRAIRFEWPDAQLMWTLARSGYPAPNGAFQAAVRRPHRLRSRDGRHSRPPPPAAAPARPGPGAPLLGDAAGAPSLRGARGDQRALRRARRVTRIARSGHTRDGARIDQDCG